MSERVGHVVGNQPEIGVELPGTPHQDDEMVDPFPGSTPFQVYIGIRVEEGNHEYYGDNGDK